MRWVLVMCRLCVGLLRLIVVTLWVWRTYGRCWRMVIVTLIRLRYGIGFLILWRWLSRGMGVR